MLFASFWDTRREIERAMDDSGHLDLLLEVDDLCAEVSVIYMTSVVSFGKM